MAVTKKPRHNNYAIEDNPSIYKCMIFGVSLFDVIRYFYFDANRTNAPLEYTAMQLLVGTP